MAVKAGARVGPGAMPRCCIHAAIASRMSPADWNRPKVGDEWARVFTGDTLLIRGTGRTDFQNGDSRVLFDSVTHKLFALPGETLVYPAHDYSGRHVSSIAQEKTRNPRLGGGKTLEEFTAIMASLNLPYPKFIDHAVPGNKACGECPTNLPQELQKYCGQMAESPQG